MLPIIKAVAMGLSAINGIASMRSMMTDARIDKTSQEKSMTTVSAPSSADASLLSSGASKTVTGAEAQDRFLKLLVTQMRNQDPLNPLDNAQVTTQLAQISTVTGVEKLNSTLQGLSSALMASQSLQSAALIGRDVMASGNVLSLGSGNATGGVDLKQAAGRVTVSVTGANGAVVRRMELGAREAGLQTFQWDGLNDAGERMPDGSYRFQVSAATGVANGAAAIDAQTLMLGRVNSVTANGGTTLLINGGTQIGIADVKRIL